MVVLLYAPFGSSARNTQQITITTENGAQPKRSHGLDDAKLASALRLKRAANPHREQWAILFVRVLVPIIPTRASTVQIAPTISRAETALMTLSSGVSLALAPPNAAMPSGAPEASSTWKTKSTANPTTATMAARRLVSRRLIRFLFFIIGDVPDSAGERSFCVSDLVPVALGNPENRTRADTMRI